MTDGETHQAPGPARHGLLGVALVVLGLATAHGGLHSAAHDHPWQTLACLAAGIALAAGRPGAWPDGLAARLFGSRRRAFYGTLFALSLAVNATAAGVLFHGIPRLDDGVSALFQARIFARLRIVLPLPPDPGFFEVFGMLGPKDHLNHWCGMYPPGWPALLTPGVWLGAPWLVAPVLGALLCIAIGLLGEAFYGRREGRVASLLALGSPFIFVLSGLHLSHVPTGLFLVLCLLAIQRLLRTGEWWAGALAGLAWGAAALCRPLTALLVGGVFALYVLAHPVRGWNARGGVIAAIGVALCMVGVLLWFQREITGDAFTAGHKVGMGARGKFGFVYLDRARTHTPAIGLHNTHLRLRALNDNILDWPIPSLALLGLAFLCVRAGRRELVLLLPLFVLLCVYAAYWYYEAYFPARYMFSGVPLALVLIARGLCAAWTACRRRGARHATAFIGGVTGCTLFLLVVATPAHTNRYTARFGDVEGILPEIMRAQDIHNAVVILDAVGVAPGLEDVRNDYYATGAMRNDLDLKGDILYVRNSRQENVRLFKNFPDRRIYFYRYLRHLDRAMLFELIQTPDGTLQSIPIRPRTPLLLESPTLPTP